MMRLLPLLVLTAAPLWISTVFAQHSPSHWNQFRGPHGNGISNAFDLPVEFDESKNVRWKLTIPDSGWSSPVIWENEIWLTTGSDERKELRALSIDVDSGEVLKDVKVFDMIERMVDPSYKFDSPHLNSPATPTPVVEEDRVYLSFGSQGLACLDRRTGRKIWERRDLRIYQPVRQGSSPIVDDKNLYVAFDGNFDQFFVALDKKTGKTRWRTDRNVQTDWGETLKNSGIKSGKVGGKPGDNRKSFATATLIEVNGQRQLIAPAAEACMAYDPDSGEELWRVLYPGGFNVAARPVYSEGLIYVFTSGLKRRLMAIRPNGRGDVTSTHIAWSTEKGTPGIPSPVVINGCLYMITDRGGILHGLDAETGEELWKLRLGGDHWASPFFADGKCYFCSKQGEVFVVKAEREQATVLAKNRLSGSFIASPATAGSSLLLRSKTHLYCLTNGFQRSQQEVDQESDAIAMREGGNDRINKSKSKVDWEAAYQKLMKNPEVRKKVESGDVTKEQVIAWLKRKSGAADKVDNAAKKKRPAKPGARPGSVNFYSIVIGRLRSKDIELGELEMDVDYCLSDAAWARDKLVGNRVKLVGISGPFLDSLLQIKRGDTFKVRTGDYDAKNNRLGFGYKFQVLEKTPPFQPEAFGVPADEFRGFSGELAGKVIEAVGYEVLLEVNHTRAAPESAARSPESSQGKRVRIAGFFRQHSDAYKDLKEGDQIRVTVAHPDPKRDSLDVTDLLIKEDK